MTKVWRLLSVLIIPLMCLGLLLLPAALPKAVSGNPGNEWSYEIQPNITKVGFNEDFTVNVSAVCYEGNSSSFFLAVEFNATLLNVTKVDTPSTLPNGDIPSMSPGYPTWSNITGMVANQYSMQPPYAPPYVEETFTMCTIHFRSLDVSGTSYLKFANVDVNNVTKIKYLVTDTTNWTKMVNGTVIIGPAFNLTVTSDGCCPITVGTLGTVAANSMKDFIVPCPNVTLTADDSGSFCNFTNWTVDNGTPTTGKSVTVEGTDGSNHTAIARCAMIGVATLEGHVNLQGLPATNVTVRFFAPNTTTEYVAMKTHTITDSNGNFTIPGIDPGTYDVGVKGSTSLSNLESGVNLTGGGTTYRDFGAFAEGDASGDDYIDGSDFGPLSVGWHGYPGAPNWNPKVDFSRDNYIDGSDFGKLSVNWHKYGDCIGWPGNWT
jgi:hypothetical protein